MRIDELHLAAFGPFTDRRIDLSRGEEGLQVVYGPNEAGKSSALRAVRALLYGVPARTADDFVHAGRSLRVGATLRARDGARIVCYRRKGRKNTLLDGAGEPLDEALMSRLLDGVDEDRFSTLFGIDHERLVSGGEALLAERGREAEALFAAGLGSNAVHAVLKALDEEAQSLFAPRASRPTINALLAELARVRKAERAASLSASRWEDARRGTGRARAALERVRAELAAAQARRRALERIRATRPGLARHRKLTARLAALGAPPRLADDFGERRQHAAASRHGAERTLPKVRQRIETLERRIEALEPPGALIEARDAIEALHQRLGERRRSLDELPRLEARREQLEALLEAQLARIARGGAPIALAALGDHLARERKTQELANLKQAREDAVQAARDRRERAAAECRRIERELERTPDPGDLSPLRSAVALARQAAHLDGQVEEATARWQQRGRECAQALAALGRWTRGLEHLVEAALPSRETVRELGERLDELDEQRRDLERRAGELEQERARAEEELRALSLEGEPPMPADLDAARAHRDRGWALLKDRWVDGEDVTRAAEAFAPGAPLEAAYEQAVQDADEVADRLRSEATRVHQAARLRARLETLDVRLRPSLDDERRRIELARAALEREWQGCWSACGVEPGGAGEMAAWLERAERLREHARQTEEHAAGLERLVRARGEAAAALAAALDDAREAPSRRSEETGPLAPVLARAEQRLEALEARARAHASLSEARSSARDALERLDGELAAAETALADWRRDWSALGSILGLSDSLTPGEMADHFALAREVVGLAKQRDELDARIRDARAERARFEREATALAERLAPDLLGQDAEHVAAELHARLVRQRETAIRRDALEADLRDAHDELAQASAERDAADAVLAALAAQAGGVAVDTLADVERRDREHRATRTELDEVEAQLLEHGGGASLAELEAAAEGIDGDALASELEALEQRIEKDLLPREDEATERMVNAQRDLDDMTAREGAAELAEQAESLLSALRGAIERFVRARLGAEVLREAIDRYRSRHRNPILESTGEYFSTLTCGAFDAVATEFDASDQPVIAARRADGSTLAVDALSTGTRDQLYLALRLAALDHYLEASDALPLIVDDILVQFDDARTRATLEALARFSRRAQVILFTHHARVADEARGMSATGGGVFVHELG